MARLLAALAKRFAARTEGASQVEYALALLLIAVVTIVMLSLLGTTLSSFFTSAAGTI